MQWINLLFLSTISLIVYHVFLFPMILLLSSGRKRRTFPPVDDESAPRAALMIAARNEEKSIEAKLENCFELDYPREKLEIVVVANGCTDRTAEIAGRYKDRGVKVFEYGEIGKTAAQNIAIRHLDCDVVVYSDANVMYDREALRHLLAPFADPTVGSVCGHHRYRRSDKPAGAAESFLWNVIEHRLKLAEAGGGGLIGANGSIYAVRVDLYRPLPHDVTSDFFEPLYLACRGYRTEYAPDAIATEEPEKDMTAEFDRRVRIIQKTVYNVLQFRWMLNPFRTGRIAWMLWSHKVLRWLFPHLLFLAVTASLIRLEKKQQNALDWMLLSGVSLFGFLALLGRGFGTKKTIPVLSHAYHIFLLFRAAVIGTYRSFTHGGIAVWGHNR